MSYYTLFTTTKRHNSTLIPSGGVEAALVLKQGQSLLRPTFLLHFNSKPTATMVEYEGRYYFVNDITAVRNDLWELACEVDPLSTYKADILATNCFVSYDTTANTELVDRRLSALTTKTQAINYGSNTFFEESSVLVGIVGKQNSGVFALSVATAANLLNTLNTWLDDDDMLPIPDVTDFSTIDDAAGVIAHNIGVGFRQLIATGKAPDCIKSAILVPVGVSKFTGSSTRIYLGDFDTGVDGLKLTSGGKASESYSIAIPWQYSDWRRNEPYTQVYLSLPYIGCVHIPSSQIMGESSLGIECTVTQSGSISYNITSGSGYSRIMRFGGNCASNFMIGASNINPFNSAMSGGTIAGAGAAAALATGPAGLIAAGTAGILGFLNGITSLPTSIGGTGGGAFSDSAVVSCFTICHNTCVDPSSVSAVMGTPTMATKTLNGLSGYVETKNFSCAGSMTDTERMMINKLMDGGVYIE